MASYHLTAKIGTKGKAAPHAAYISRTDKYSEGKRYEDIEATGYGNMPAWAVHNPAYFWKAADQHERANGSTYREIEIALPRELTKDQRLELVQDFINQEIGKAHAYQFAIHNPKATIDKGEQPHAHIMYSERIIDGIERNPEQYFKRYNAKNREKGGAKKHSGGKRADELKAELIATRERWATIQNQHLKKHGHSDQVTHLSLEDQGINRTPEKHIGIKAYKMKPTDKTALVERRAITKEQTTAVSELSGLDLTKAIRTEQWIKEREEQRLKERIAEEQRQLALLNQAKADSDTQQLKATIKAEASEIAAKFRQERAERAAALERQKQADAQRDRPTKKPKNQDLER
jgi:hypothetical protein